MTVNQIKESLNRLRRALDKLDPADEDSRKKLSMLIEDVSRKLAAPANKERDRHLNDALGEAILHFKTKHPVIMETLDEVKQALYSIGL